MPNLFQILFIEIAQLDLERFAEVHISIGPNYWS
jgi:hypothetical protein